MGNNLVKSESLGYFNLARGVGMVMVLIGHSMNPLLSAAGEPHLFSGAGSVLGGGIMAAFFMISGFGFYKRNMRKCLAIQKKFLLRPYFLVAAAVLATKLALALVERRDFLHHGGEMVLTYLFGLNAKDGGSFCGIPVDSVSILWFILALAEGWVIYNYCVQLQSVALRRGLIVGCVVLSYVLTLVSNVWPFCLPMALMATGYIAVGDYIRKNHLLEKKLPLWLWVLLVIIMLLCMAFGGADIGACVWKLGLLDVAGSFCVGFLLLRLYALLMEKDWHGRISGLLEEIGFNSIWVVCLHAYEKKIIPWYRVYSIFPDQPWLAVILCFAGRCIVMYLIYRVIICVGRKWKRRGRKAKITIEI